MKKAFMKKATVCVRSRVLEFCCLLAILLMAGVAWAAPMEQRIGESTNVVPAAAACPAPFEVPGYDGSLWRSLLALTLVLGGLGAARFYIARRNPLGPRQGRNRRLRVVERIPIDQRKSILLLALDGREFLVGVGADRIAMLAEGESPFEYPPETQGTGGAGRNE